MALASETTAPQTDTGLPANRVYTITALCLLIGFAVGYFFVGSPGVPSMQRSKAAGNALGSSATFTGGRPKLTIEQMKQMADVQASTLVEKSKAEPKNAALLLQIARIYQASHQFKDAAGYFQKALKLEPKNVPARTELASCLYYGDDSDGAIAELNQVLKYNPKDANALFNLGMIKYRGKNDPAGAIAAWQQLLKTNPTLDRKPMVEQLITEAKASTSTVKN
jgi:cytochrome c-type biogenesis protein CcmH/NrfG